MNTRYSNIFLDGISKIKNVYFFIFLFAYQVLFLFQGLDFTDEGFYPTFYREIFTDPESVKYNFMYWFSGILGGLWHKLFSPFGLLGIRFGGAFITTATIILVYKFLKKYIDETCVKLGLLLLVLFLNNDPKELYYNNISAFFYVLTIILLVTALARSRQYLFVLAGACVAINIFSRIPNVLQCGLAIIIVYYGILSKLSIGKQIRFCLLFFAGIAATSGILIVVMKLLNHYDLFIQAIDFVSRLGKTNTIATGQYKDISSYYGIQVQLRTFWSHHSTALKYVATLTLVVLLLALSSGPAKKMLGKWKWVWVALKYALIVGSIVFVFSGVRILNNVPNIVVLYFFAGLSLMATLFIVITPGDKVLKIIAVAGTYISLTYSFGSSSGLWTSGLYSFWISVPVAVHQFFSFDQFGIDARWKNKNFTRENSMIVLISKRQLNEVGKWGIVVCIIGCLCGVMYYPFGDKAARTELVYGVDNKHIRGILTTKERALVVNELLRASARYVKPGDYVMAYDAIPMYHYLTDTKPFMYNSYLWLYQLDVFKEQLAIALKERKSLPVVVCQREATNGWRGYSWPVGSTDEYTEWNGHRNEVLNEFLSKNNYTEVWSNSMFRILLPG